MPRKYLPIVAHDPYHLNARCINRQWFKLPLPTVWSIMEDYLYLVAKGYNLQILAFVLMSNHFHLLARAPEGNLSAAMLYFMRETSKEITRLSGRINQTYGGRHYKTWIPTFHHFMNTYKYIYRNPVRAKIVERVEDYPFSTLQGLLGQRHLAIPMAEDTLLFEPETLSWLNTPPKENLETEMKIALKRPKFELNTSRQSGRKSLLEVDRL